MLTEDHHVLRRALDWSAGGQRFVLVSVLQTWGSAPRQPGAWMALCEDGRVAGSVSGGCIEADLIARRQAGLLAGPPAALLRYGVSREEAARFRLPCGGELLLLLETTPDLEMLVRLETALTARRRLVREVTLADGRSRLRAVCRGETTRFDGSVWHCVHGPSYRLLLIGAGELSRAVAQIGCLLGYQVEVCDPRAEYADEWDVPGVPLTREMPDDAVLAWQADADSAVLALSHDPKLDDLALIDALQGEAGYVGALGSPRSAAQKRERLKLFDLDEAQLARLRCPVGLDLGAHAPGEIAVAILAELTGRRHGHG